LKCLSRLAYQILDLVALHRSAWIEICLLLAWAGSVLVALHRSAWIEIVIVPYIAPLYCVALHRSAWIEISFSFLYFVTVLCRTPQECVD